MSEIELLELLILTRLYFHTTFSLIEITLLCEFFCDDDDELFQREKNLYFFAKKFLVTNAHPSKTVFLFCFFLLLSFYIFVHGLLIIIECQIVSRCAMQGKYFDSSRNAIFFPFIVIQKIRMIFLPFALFTRQQVHQRSGANETRTFLNV